ncbi:MAG TPA: hypothetical protein VJZ00_25015 [Thermoanaerobaculia bacterium]|nr:hypothetical protein [Thermoanaerobaculia bacterium]
MILYRKGAPLRIRRFAAPEPPFWCATSIAPYAAKRATPVAIDYATLRASGAERIEVAVCDNVRDELERTRALERPVLIEATEAAEEVFRRGEEALEFVEEATLLVSTRGVLPSRGNENAVIAIAAWPLELPRLRELFAEARDKKLRWGVAVPIVYPVTTELAALDALAEAGEGAAFLAAIPIGVEPTAKHALAQSMQLGDDDDRYAMLFHGDAAPVQLATERHVAALAFERGLADFIVPPRWSERTNWNAAVLLTLTASRMIAMDLDLDLAGRIARSARAIAELDKPIARVAEAASVAIIGGVDETSAEMLTEWLASGSASFAEYVDEQWRSRRA